MQIFCKLFLIFAAGLLANCQSRAHISRTSEAAPSAPKLKGRVAVVVIYNKTTQSTRQAPGIMVSSRGILISGLQADETLSLAYDHRRGEKYFPIPSTQNGTFFVGLDAEQPAIDKQAGLTLAPATANATGSAQSLKPLDLTPLSLRDRRVIMYNDLGWVRAFATTGNNGRMVTLHDIKMPKSYVSEKDFGPFPDDNAFRYREGNTLDAEAGINMLRKGGAIFAEDQKVGGAEFVILQNGTSSLRGPKQPDTVDIIAFVNADPSLPFETYPPRVLSSINVLPKEIAASVEAVSVKFKIPGELKREIQPYLDCDS